MTTIPVDQLTVSARLKHRPEDSVVEFWWRSSNPDLRIDRPHAFSIQVTNYTIAQRLIRATSAGVIFPEPGKPGAPEVKVDIYNQTYVEARCLVNAKRLNADLRRLGF